MTLKQSQSHQTDDENLDPEQGYNRAKFERSRLNSVQEKGSVKVVFFFKRGNMPIISLEYVRKSKTIMYSLTN